MPSVNDTRVRVDGLSKRTATARGPASGCRPSRSAFIPSARSSTSTSSSGVRSSSRRKCRVTVRPLRRRRAAATVAASRTSGRALRNESACVSVRTSGGTSRTTSGATALTRNPCSRAAVSTSAATGAVSTMPSIRPAPRTVATSGWPRPVMPADSAFPSDSARSSRPSASIVSSTASAAAQDTGLPPKVVPCWPGCSSAAASPKREAGADRQPAAEALGQGEDVRLDAGGLVGEPRAGAADAGLHLVEHQQRTAGAG